MILKDEHLTRQADLIPSSVLSTPITIVGAGAIGSWVPFTLAKMGFSNLTVIDYDDVEIVNMNSQIYRMSDIGKPKVEALKEIIREFTNVEITAVNDKYVGGRFNGIVIAALDNMDARKLIFEQHKLQSMGTKAIIDARMAAEFARMVTYNPSILEECDTYANTLHSDKDSVQERCTAKSTGYTATLISGFICKNVKALLTDGKYIKNLMYDIGANDCVIFGNK